MHQAVGGGADGAEGAGHLAARRGGEPLELVADAARIAAVAVDGQLIADLTGHCNCGTEQQQATPGLDVGSAHSVASA